MTKKVKTLKVTDISIRLVGSGRMNVHKGYQADGTIVGGNLYILRDPISGRLQNEKARNKLEKQVRKAYKEGQALFN
jgi:Icc-related predicted phosphoesterase